MPATITVGGKGATFKFTEFDGPNGTGSMVIPFDTIVYASDNQAVATVDQTGAVVAVGPGVANISGTDPGTNINGVHVSASDVLTVTGAVSATGSLTANP